MKSQLSMGFKYGDFMGKSVKENASLGEDFAYSIILLLTSRFKFFCKDRKLYK